MPTSFVYEDLISKVQTIQNQMDKIHIVLTDRWENEKRKRDELKSRSLVFIDPYGNQTINKYMDHQIIDNIIRKYNKDYVPKYLQQWIQMGTMKENRISPLNDWKLKGNVMSYSNGYQFITYGEVIVWIGNYDNTELQKIILRVLLMDSLEKIKTQMKKFHQFDNIELKSYITNSNEQPNEENWNEGTLLKSEDTILSSQLFQNNCVIMAKINQDKVNHHFPFILMSCTSFSSG
jgi:hypothetical protein